MEPRAKQGIDILFPASVIYSLNLMTDEYTESTETNDSNIRILNNNISNINIYYHVARRVSAESNECGIFLQWQH